MEETPTTLSGHQRGEGLREREGERRKKKEGREGEN